MAAGVSGASDRSSSIASSATVSPSPITVPFDVVRSASASTTSSRTCVGRTTSCAPLANVVNPTRNSGGSSSRNALAAVSAAVSRSGVTSVAFIESETSSTSTITGEASWTAKRNPLNA